MTTYTNFKSTSSKLSGDFILKTLHTLSEEQTRVIVREGDTLRLSCNPMGRPEPTVEWRRADDTAVIQVILEPTTTLPLVVQR